MALPLCTHRYILFVSYLGTKYGGSQRQVSREKIGNQDTVQEAIEWSLEGVIPAAKCRTTASSRTDKGVHALFNCFSLPLMDFKNPTEKIKRFANYNLMRKNHEIAINEVLLVPYEFHPRKCAVSREYIYRIAVFNQLDEEQIKGKKHNPVEMMPFLPVTELYKVLPIPCFNLDRASEAINLLRGEHDFASFSFRSNQIPDDEDTVRDLEINISQVETNSNIDQNKSLPYSLYNLHFKSRAFLYNQVRRMVGSIISYATYQTVDIRQIKSLLDTPDSSNWRASMLIAEPWGLFLSKVNYEKKSLENSYKILDDESEERVQYFQPE